MSTVTEKPVKVKKDKSSKKRKAESIAEQAVKSSSPQPTADDLQSDNVLAEATAVEAGSPEPPKKKRKGSLASEIEVDITLPEPPSKKALRRLKKGKPLPPSKSGAESTPEPETDTASKKPETEKRSEHGIWIGNLPWSVTKTDLRKFLTENSEISDESITRIHMPSPDDGKPANKVEESKAWKKQHNKGFAYVDFSTPEAVVGAVELSEQLLQGRRVLIKNHKSFEGRPVKTKDESRAEGKEPSKRVFVGNLRFDTTEDSLKEHFEHCGPIEHIMIATFEDSGKCKGYGWITFEELEAAEAAVRGWIKVELNDESDSDESSGNEGEGGEDDESSAKAKPGKPKKAAFRKQFVDKIHMRPIRREFAEAPQVRYKKRYGKDGTKNKLGGEGTGDAGDSTQARVSESRVRERAHPAAKVKYRNDYAPRLTGGIVESKGKKVVF